MQLKSPWAGRMYVNRKASLPAIRFRRLIGREGKMQEAQHPLDLLLKELQDLESALEMTLKELEA